MFTGLPVDDCNVMTAAAFTGWNDGNEPPVPLKYVGDKILLETGQGPTLAFKDIGQQVVAQLLNFYLGRRGARANIMVETSGDTGPAAIDGVRGCPHVEIFCMYPSGRVSPVQELQLITVDEPNVHVYRTEGNSDLQAQILRDIFREKVLRSYVVGHVERARVFCAGFYARPQCLLRQFHQLGSHCIPEFLLRLGVPAGWWRSRLCAC